MVSQLVAWLRNRVVNFRRDFAEGYVKVLVALDGRPYDQSLFFKLLADEGLIGDVVQTGTPEQVAARRAKRWDSYLGKIREFGLGFATDEHRKGGSVRTVWRASAVARDFAGGSLSYRQFMALQLVRFQLPKPTLPIQASTRNEIARGINVRPIGLILEGLDLLRAKGAGEYLSRGELQRHITAVENHAGLPAAIDAIVLERSGGSRAAEDARAEAEPQDDDGSDEDEEVRPTTDPAVGPGTSQASLDIWINEFEATGYVRQLKPQPGSGLPAHIVVRELPRSPEADELLGAIPLQSYAATEEAIDGYFEFLMASPSSKERTILFMDPRVVEIEVNSDVRFDPKLGLLTGPVGLIGGLPENCLVVLRGDTLMAEALSTIFEVRGAASRPTGSTVSVSLSAAFIRADKKPVDVSTS